MICATLQAVVDNYTLSAESPVLDVSAESQYVKQELHITPYSGEYEFTPSAETQTLPTAMRELTQDIVINPIPSNYGLITWNGSTLTVS